MTPKIALKCHDCNANLTMSECQCSIVACSAKLGKMRKIRFNVKFSKGIIICGCVLGCEFGQC